MSFSFPEKSDGLPQICGYEKLIDDAKKSDTYPQSFFQITNGLDSIKSACAIALHMHQPLIPKGVSHVSASNLISNLQYMMENQHIGDNHNAPAFVWCYKRMAEYVDQLLNENKRPRIMLEYSGELLYGFQQMGLHDIIDALVRVTTDSAYCQCVEWLGCSWGHAVAPSTPSHDYRLHVKAWQHHFASMFGLEALKRVVGFSAAEMALPNHPDTAYEFVKTLVECGYQWIIVQEHTVEIPLTGEPVNQKHVPHRLICTNSNGEQISIIAIIKTQGSDTKLVAQMQPYYEAKNLNRVELGGKMIPPLVTQIADGENGGVMMNEFPAHYMHVVHQSTGSDTALLNVTEYLRYLFSLGIKEHDLPVVQPLFQKKIWDNFIPGQGQEKLSEVIQCLQKDNRGFSMEGGSWTNSISWVKNYDALLDPMNRLSALFHEKVLKTLIPTTEQRYCNVLYHLLVSQTSCYRYWGQGMWTDYGQEVCRRGIEILINDFK